MIIMGLCFVLISIVYSINVNLLFPVYKYVSKNSPNFLKVRIPVLFSLLYFAFFDKVFLAFCVEIGMNLMYNDKKLKSGFIEGEYIL